MQSLIDTLKLSIQHANLTDKKIFTFSNETTMTNHFRHGKIKKIFLDIAPSAPANYFLSEKFKFDTIFPAKK